ncbi:MAG: hypothetical protein JSU09_06660 [Bacteroidetes bacterium]|nr:hypothetical protein [Bacteroidota bacterium]
MPAWFTLLAIGWEAIQDQKIKIVLSAAIFISSILNLTWHLNYYNRIEKAQYREVNELVKKQNVKNLSVYPSLSWHRNLYFRKESYRAHQVQYEKLPDRFWLVQSHSVEVMAKQVNALQHQSKFVDSFKFRKANAFFFSRR